MAKIMKLIHTSDIHFGISVNERSLAEEQEKVVSEILRAADETGADGLIIAGDVFDRAVTNAKALSLYDDLITELYKRDRRVFVIAGNHDAPDRLALLGGLLNKSGIYISGRLTADIEPISFGNCDIYLLPYFNLDSAKALYPDESFESYQQAFCFVTAKIREKMDKSRFNIAVSHSYVAGGELSESDRAARLGQAMIVPSEAFEGFDYTALGHLHAPHFVAEKVRYSGTPYPYSFGEKGGGKTLTIIDTENGEISYFPMNSFARTLRTVKDTYENIREAAEKDENKDDYIKIILTDKYPTADVYAEFRSVYPNLLAFEGAVYGAESSASALSAEKLDAIDPDELLESYFEGRKEALGDFEKRWFQKALEAVTKGDDAQ